MRRASREPVYIKIAALLLAVVIVASTVFGVYLLIGVNRANNINAISQPLTSVKEQNLTSRPIRDPDSEVRGVWIATVSNIDFPSKPGLSAEELKKELRDIVDTVKSANLTSIYFQVRPTCDALYDSEYFPASAYLTGSQDKDFAGGFDVFEYLIDIAHAEDIDVHAWVNPLRVTSGTEANPAHDLNSLGLNNPARLHPEWTVKYADGKIYLNAGIADVRKLVADGCAEIVENYNVDGIIFDDYFYPYPVTGASFDDDAQYKSYIGDLSKDDWRRENINQMVKGCYDAIKAIRPDCKFGISPFGIWQNDDGQNGGSATNGFESYKSLYCDAKAWIEGGYIDYIAPQLYWQFSQSSAKFDVLCRWWNALCDGTGVDLLIAHGAYRSAEWGSDCEIKNQVEFARSEMTYRGSIMYGYAAIKRNDQDLLGQLREVYSHNIVYTDPHSNASLLQISSPADKSTLQYDNIYLIGSSDPAYPVYLNNKKISRTKSGYFSLYVPLNEGENVFTFVQNGLGINYTVTNGTVKSETVWKTMDEYSVVPILPANNYNIKGGERIAVSAYAPSGSKVTAVLGNITVNLTQSTYPKGNSKLLQAKYDGSITLPKAEAGSQLQLGNIVYKAKRGFESAETIGASVTVNNRDIICAIEVVRNDSELKVSPTSWYYDDYTPAAIGMRANAVRLADGFYKLEMGGYIAESDVCVIDESVSDEYAIRSLSIDVSNGKTRLMIESDGKCAVNGYMNDDGLFSLAVYNSLCNVSGVKIEKNPIFESAEIEKNEEKNWVKILLKPYSIDNFYGFEYYYTDGYTVVEFRNPQTLADGELPLLGKTIVVDAGHGGSETGTGTPKPNYYEKALNLSISQALCDKLKALGANVLMIRTEDVTVPIADRLNYLIEVEPDICVSIHHNSMTFDTDITTIRGLLGLYFADSGRLLAKCISSSAADELNLYERSVAKQRLAMVRNPKFPSMLLEVGFVTCVEEFEMLSSAMGIDRAAEGVAKGIIEYYKAQSEFIR